MSYANAHDYDIDDGDVKNEFQHAKLEEEIYITQPEGFVDLAHPDWVCFLHKSLYGLKHSREWYCAIDKHLQNNGFTTNNSRSLSLLCL